MAKERILKGRYRVEAKLGRGAMGEVYRATDLQTEEPVAVKTMMADFIADEHYRKRFTREVAALRKLKHPNILGYVDAFTVSEHVFLVMEYVGGGTLESYIEAKKEVPIGMFKQWAIKITGAVAAAHEHGIYHRDLKPANILLTADGEPKVADFGLAKVTDLSTMTATGTAMGTLAYMPPEAFDALAKQDHRADLWALGVIFFEMLTGTLPFMGRSQPELIAAILTDHPTPVTKLRRDLPRGWNDIIMHCLERYPQYRYQSARHLLRDIRSDRLHPESRESVATIELAPEDHRPNDHPADHLVGAAGVGAAAGAAFVGQHDDQGIALDEAEGWTFYQDDADESAPNQADWSAFFTPATMVSGDGMVDSELVDFASKYMSGEAKARAQSAVPATHHKKKTRGVKKTKRKVTHLPPVNEAELAYKEREQVRRYSLFAGIGTLAVAMAWIGIMFMVASIVITVVNMAAPDSEFTMRASTLRGIQVIGVVLFHLALLFKALVYEGRRSAGMLVLFVIGGASWFLFLFLFYGDFLADMLRLTLGVAEILIYFRLDS